MGDAAAAGCHGSGAARAGPRQRMQREAGGRAAAAAAVVAAAAASPDVAEVADSFRRSAATPHARLPVCAHEPAAVRHHPDAAGGAVQLCVSGGGAGLRRHPERGGTQQQQDIGALCAEAIHAPQLKHCGGRTLPVSNVVPAFAPERHNTRNRMRNRTLNRHSQPLARLQPERTRNPPPACGIRTCIRMCTVTPAPTRTHPLRAAPGKNMYY